MRKFLTYLLTLVVYFNSLTGLHAAPKTVQPPSPPQLPESARAVLQKLPGQTLTLDFIVQGAVGASESYRSLQSEEFRIEVPTLQAEAAFAPQLSASFLKSLDRSEPTSPFGTIEVDASTANLTLSKLFATTGTLFSVEANQNQGRTVLGSAAFPQLPYQFDTKGTARIQQSLWKDFFGYGSRRLVTAGELSRDGARAAFQEANEDWLTGLVQVYYGAWQAQNRMNTASESLKRRERLFSVTQSKLQRGTAEKPDALQIESAVASTRVSVMEAQQVLQKTWTDLVTTLGLPHEWLKIDPALIPLALDDRTQPAIAICEQMAQKNDWANVKTTSTLQKLQLQKQAAKLRMERAENNKNPDLKLLGAVTSNGVDREVDRSFQEATKEGHPGWSVGVTLKMPLAFDAEEAERLAASADHQRFDALYNQAQSQLPSQWQNDCQDLKRLVESQKLLKDAYEKQKMRAKLEEDRFRIGRVPTLNVIQAGDDATQTELSWRSIEVQLRLASWKILRMNGDMYEYLRRLKSEARAQL